MADKQIRVLLVDDHQVVRRGLRTFLEVQDDIEVVGEASDGAEGVASAEELRPDVVLMDVKMPGTDGIEALKQLRELDNPARVLIVTSFTEQRTVVPALRGRRLRIRLQGHRPRRAGRRDPLRPRGAHPAPARGRGRAPRPGRLPRGHGTRLDPHGAGARGPRPDRGRPVQPRDRPRARPLREDGQDARLEHPHEARPRGPHPGGALGGPARPHQLTPPGRPLARRGARPFSPSYRRVYVPRSAQPAGGAAFSMACCG